MRRPAPTTRTSAPATPVAGPIRNPQSAIRNPQSSVRNPQSRDHSPLTTHHSPAAAPPRGFTLVELMIVIVIISILIALILPAVGAVRTRVRVGQVSSDMSLLATSIAEFKRQHGMEPPSRIRIYPPGDASAWDTTSRGYIRRMWPQFDFQTSGGLDLSKLPVAARNQLQSNGFIELHGGECLVFFLGGLPVEENGALRTDGFSKHPSLPFRLSDVAPNRDGSYFEFDTTRLVDANNNGIPEYRDPLSGASAPYVYFSSYDGQGYRPADAVAVGMTEAYRQGSQYFRPKAYQIISAGFDGKFGTGGAFDPNDPAGSLAGRLAEFDNITNFHGGMLSP